jgi:hypothetical protein
LETMWKNRGLMFEDIHMLFLCPLTSIHVSKSREPYFLTSRHNYCSWVDFKSLNKPSI